MVFGRPLEVGATPGLFGAPWPNRVQKSLDQEVSGPQMDSWVPPLPPSILPLEGI